MNRRLLPSILLIGFALAVGHFATRTCQPHSAPEYFIGGALRPFQWHDVEHTPKNLYLRRTWYLTQAPTHAWLSLVGHDKIDVIVNEQRVGTSDRAHHRTSTGILLDITRYLKVGRNAIAVTVAQQTLHRPPVVAIDGTVRLVGGSERSLGDPRTWRMIDHYDRQETFWWAPEFKDDHWSRPTQGERTSLRAQVAMPPRSITQPTVASWITPPADQKGNAAVRTTFDVPLKPYQAWMRVTTTGPYRLAVNGVLVADDQEELATPAPYVPVQRTYDISRFVRHGTNSVAVMLATGSEAPHVLADLEIADRSGRRVQHHTDAEWLGAAGTPVDWLARTWNPQGSWQPCRVEDGNVGVTPWSIRRDLVEVNHPPASRLKATTIELAIMTACGLLAWLGCVTVGRIAQWLARKVEADVPPALAYVALLPSTLIATLGAMLTYDIAWGVSDVYRPIWLVALVVAVLLQWCFLLFLAADTQAIVPLGHGRSLPSRRWAVAIGLVLLCGVGLWLRLRNILAEPVHHDEVGAYMFSLGVLKYGFPGGQVHPNFVFGWCATSELVYFPMAPFTYLFENPLLALRVPTVLWSIGTLLLIYYVGRRLFTPMVGLIAATIFTLSPYAVGMANFGRYFSQLQFCALLTVYFFYQTIRGDGPINRRALWITTIAFCATFLSWEGSALLAPGMIVAALIQRRRNLKSIFTCPSIYAAVFLVALCVLAQGTHRTLQQTQRMSFGSGISDLSLKPMWRYVIFEPAFYFMECSWMDDALLPMIGLVAAIALAMRSRFQEPLRVLLLVLLGNCGVMMAVLPLRSGRYAYHLMPLLILCVAVTLVAAARSLIKLAEGRQVPRWCRAYARAVCTATIGALVLFGCGQWVHTSELGDFKTRAYQAGILRFPDWEGPMRHVRKNMQEGDIVITLYPHAVNFTMVTAKDDPVDPDWRCDYWLQSTLIVQSTLDDVRTVPLDRRSGAVMIPDLATLEQIFARNDRIWYCTIRSAQSRVNDKNVSEFIRQHMDVVHEDFRTTVMFRDKQHRPATLRLIDEDKSQSAHEWYLR